MVSKAMERVAAQSKTTQAAPTTVAPSSPAQRSEQLKNVNVERWLREQIKAHKKDAATSVATKVEYRSISDNLEMTRPALWEPVQIDKKAGTKNTFYKYRAATRFVALERAQVALRVYGNTKDEIEKKAAYAVMLTAAADLARYPADAQPGLEPKKLIQQLQVIGDEDLANSLKKQKS